jgi:hypothetical protein
MAEPGWYDDPSDPGASRWFDGAQWTHHTQPKAAPAPQRRAGPGPDPAAASQRRARYGAPGGGVDPSTARRRLLVVVGGGALVVVLVAALLLRGGGGKGGVVSFAKGEWSCTATDPGDDDSPYRYAVTVSVDKDGDSGHLDLVAQSDGSKDSILWELSGGRLRAYVYGAPATLDGVSLDSDHLIANGGGDEDEPLDVDLDRSGSSVALRWHDRSDPDEPINTVTCHR